MQLSYYLEMWVDDHKKRKCLNINEYFNMMNIHMWQ